MQAGSVANGLQAILLLMLALLQLLLRLLLRCCSRAARDLRERVHVQVQVLVRPVPLRPRHAPGQDQHSRAGVPQALKAGGQAEGGCVSHSQCARVPADWQ